MVRSSNAETGQFFANANAEWPSTTPTTANHHMDDNLRGSSHHGLKGFGGLEGSVDDAAERKGMTEADGWDFNESSSFIESAARHGTRLCRTGQIPTCSR